MPYATRRYGTFLYGEPTSAISGGGRVMSVELWRMTIDNVRVENLSDYLVSGVVDLNLDRAVKLSATFTMRQPARVTPYADYLAPWVRVHYDDGSTPVYEQAGLFTTRVPEGSRTLNDSVGTYQCDDLTSLLATYAYSDADNVAAATNYKTAITDTLADVGITRHTIPETTDTLATAQTFPVGTRGLDKCNTLIRALGWYQLGSDLDGRLSTPGEPKALKSMQPWRTLTADDLFGGSIDVRAPGKEIANVVIVVNDDAKSAPMKSIARNDDAASPTSTVAIGREIVRVEKVTGKTTQAKLDKLAARYLAESRTYYQTARLKLLHDPTALIAHQVLELDLTGECEALNGLWWIRTARLPLTPGSPMEIECSRVTNSFDGVDV